MVWASHCKRAEAYRVVAPPDYARWLAPAKHTPPSAPGSRHGACSVGLAASDGVAVPAQKLHRGRDEQDREEQRIGRELVDG